MKTSLILATVIAALAAAAPASFAAHSTGGYRLTTDTLGGNGHARVTHGYRLITDTLGGNGHARVTHGYRLITDTLAPGGGVDAPLGGVASGGKTFNWGDAGIGAAGAVGTALVLIGGSLVVLRKRNRLAI